MGAVNFLFALHNHQPVGNFGWVFEDAYERCYLPLVEHLERFPVVRAALHHSGPLLEWIESERPEYIKKVRGLVDRGQVEILGGGMYEPILSTLTDDDAVGQILRMTEYVRDRFGATVRGIWLTERIWEPSLPRVLARAGVEFTITDESHFRYAGIEKNRMFGYYVTEDKGSRVFVFPIDMELRYRIPFAEVPRTIEYLSEVADRGPDLAATYGDDGEKFGVWPQTHEWVYGQKWLETFFTALTDNRDWIDMPHFGEYLDAHRPLGRVYLPTASYEEMMEWALPSGSTREIQDIVHELKDAGSYERFHPFLRGGFWPNFFTKYPEANRMHKKMLAVSRRVAEAYPDSGTSAEPPEAVRELYRSQCNCPYWHGLFGGLYLNYLRHAVYQCMLRAETLADETLAAAGSPRALIETVDVDTDGADELVVTGAKLGLVIEPDEGGTVDLLAAREFAFMLTNTLTRREEAYHRKIVPADAESDGDDGGPKSIHDLQHSKEEGLDRMLLYDRHDRRCFRDHVTDAVADLELFHADTFTERGDFADGMYEVASAEESGRTATVRLAREGTVRQDDENHALAIEKVFSVDPDAGSMRVDYTLTNRSEARLAFRFGVEQNLTLLAGTAEDRYYLVDGKKPDAPLMGDAGDADGVESACLVDEFFGFAARLGASAPFTLWRFPVETVSQSEGGFERTYQGSALMQSWAVELAPGAAWTVAVTLEVAAIS